MYKKALLCYNPISGDHTIPHKLDHILGRFQEKGVLVQPFRITGGSPGTLSDTLTGLGFDYIIAAGGDGTLNYIVNTVLKKRIDIPIGIIPAGTCNDIARSIRLPNSLDECIDVILAGKASGIDAGIVNEDIYFASVFAGGSLVDISYSTNHELKRNFGPFAYYLKGLSEVASLRCFKIRITTDTRIIEEKAVLFLVMNGKDVGGFTDVAKEADVSDGLMDILLIKNCSHMDLANLFFKVVSHESLNDRNVIRLKAKSCLIESKVDVAVSVDGEKGPGLPASIRFINKALNVFVK